MPFNLIGANEAAPGTGTVNVAFPQDDRYSRFDSNDSIRISKGMLHLLGVLYAAESTGARALIRQPKQTDKAFLKCALTTDLDPTQGYEHYFKNPIKLVEGKLEAFSVNATDEDTIIGLMLGSGYIDPKPQTIDEIIDGYSDTTATALTWSDCTMTWNQSLAKGTYSVIGMRASVFLAANLWTTLVRLNIPSNTLWKPGVPATLAEADHEELQSQTFEPWNFWGDIGVKFNAPDQMPNIQVLSPSAVTDENVQLALKKVG